MSKKGYTITAFETTDKLGEFKQTTYQAQPLKDDEIYIKMLACGLCHTDVLYMGQPNMILGHEPVGEVADVGSSVKRFKKGDLVGFSYLRDCCLNCRQCNSGQDIMCPDRVMFPEGNNNGFAHGVVCKDKFVYGIPKGLTAQEAAPLMCAGLTVFSALYQSNVPPTGRVAVVGIGGLGHLALQFARAWGYHVTAISHTPAKKEECLKFGAHEFMASKDFTPEYIEKAPRFDLILDTVSVSLEWDTYIELLDRNGSFFLIGIPEKPIQISNILPFLQSQKVFKGAILGGRYIVDLMLEFAARHGIKPAIVEYPMTPEGITKAIKDSENNSVRYRAVLMPQH
ncbi:chaperonin 10-like protein [Fennellomyces sp. T-0311]|nr:chaperonin 10-like protein [Fennellomyces sp. T-0311]